MRGADLVLADSAALAEAARALVPDGPAVEVFHPGVDLERFSPGDRAEVRTALAWAQEVPTVVSARALAPLYNQATVVRAIALVRDVVPDVRLVIKQPGGAIPPAIRDAIRDANLSESVDVVGHVDAAIMPLLYQAADVVVSIPSSDSSPATAWEALACGRPLVVSDLPWARAELQHRQMRG